MQALAYTGSCVPALTRVSCSDQMVDPAYQELTAEQIPEATAPGVSVKVVAGESYGVSADVKTRTPAMYLHVRMEAGADFEQKIPDEYTSGFVYIVAGSGTFGKDKEKGAAHQCLVLNDEGNGLTAHADEKMEFALIAGQPLKEPVSKYGEFRSTL